MLGQAANIATIIGTGIAVWAALSRVLTRARRRQVVETLTKGEAQLLALLGAAFAATLALVLVLVVQHSADLAEQKAGVAAFTKAARSVEGYGVAITAALRVLFLHLGLHWPPS